jgi:hypothetical protein
MRRLTVRAVTVLLTAWWLGACGSANVAPSAGRQLIITVENTSRAPARLVVAENVSPIGPIVGTAVPDLVPAGVTQDVVFTVPADEGWAIFLNHEKYRGALVLAMELTGRSGKLPVTIAIDADGEVIWREHSE